MTEHNFRNIRLVVNPAAGQPQPILRAINDVFHGQEIDWTVNLTRHAGHGEELAQQAVEEGVDLVMVYGGDGTVKEVMNGLINTDVPLAILHGGTGNAFAHELSIPASLTDATKLVLGGSRIRGVDVGKIICRNDPDTVGYFLLRASIGLQTDILETADRELKDQFGNLAYVMASLQELAQSKLRRFEVTIDGEEHEAEGLSCMITNSASVGGAASFNFAPDVDPSDGKLDVLVIDAAFESMVQAVGSAMGVEGARFKQHWTGSEIVVEAGGGALAVTLDGESFGHTPVEVSILPEAVQVIVPA